MTDFADVSSSTVISLCGGRMMVGQLGSMTGAAAPRPIFLK
jgi:hypothetical protein